MKTQNYLLLLVLCLSVSITALGQTTDEARYLEPGQNINREIAGGESHIYQIRLQAGQFVRVVVEQRGIDVKLALAGPDGKPLVESDLTGIIGLSESLSYEVAAAGTYQLVVRANGATTQHGAYAIRLEAKASASAQDRKRLTAESLITETGRLYDQGPSADSQLSEKVEQALGLCREVEDHYLQGVCNRRILYDTGWSRFRRNEIVLRFRVRPAAREPDRYEAKPKADGGGAHEWAFRAPEATLTYRTGRPLGKHFAGPTWDNHVARFRNAFDNVQRVHRGEKPSWVVPELAHLVK